MSCLNWRTAIDVEEIIRNNGATPATIAILNGKIHVGKNFILTFKILINYINLPSFFIFLMFPPLKDIQKYGFCIVQGEDYQKEQKVSSLTRHWYRLFSHVGVPKADIDFLASGNSGAVKTSRRDLPIVLSRVRVKRFLLVSRCSCTSVRGDLWSLT